jgi:hypothetical protein
MIRPYSQNASWDFILRPFAFFAAILLFFGCGTAALVSWSRNTFTECSVLPPLKKGDRGGFESIAHK